MPNLSFTYFNFAPSNLNTSSFLSSSNSTCSANHSISLFLSKRKVPSRSHFAPDKLPFNNFSTVASGTFKKFAVSLIVKKGGQPLQTIIRSSFTSSHWLILVFLSLKAYSVFLVCFNSLQNFSTTLANSLRPATAGSRTLFRFFRSSVPNFRHRHISPISSLPLFHRNSISKSTTKTL